MTFEERIDHWLEQLKQAHIRVAVAKDQLRRLYHNEDSEETQSAPLVIRAPVPSIAVRTSMRRGLWAAYEDARNAEELARRNVAQVRADAEVAVRQGAQEQGTKLTDAAVRAHAKTHPTVVEAEARLQQAIEARQQARSALHQRDDVQEVIPQPTLPSSPPDAAPLHESSRDEEAILQARHELDLARAEVAYQEAVGRALHILATANTSLSITRVRE